jgi:hypothetical protein
MEEKHLKMLKTYGAKLNKDGLLLLNKDDRDSTK